MKFNLSSTRYGMIAALAFILTACDQSQSSKELLVSTPLVSAVSLTPEALTVRDTLSGRVAPVRIAEIRAQIGGIVQEKLFDQGSDVKAGQPLYQINPAPFLAEVDSATAALKRAELSLAHSQKQIVRLNSLLNSNSISRQVYDDEVFKRDQALAEVAQARATLARRKLDLTFATVEAPISGRIDQTLVSEGALVSSTDSSPMARIQQIDQVYLDLRRPASSLESLQKALTKQGVEDGLLISVLRSNGEPYDLKGYIVFSGISVDAGTGDVLLRVLIDNSGQQLLPGMFVQAKVDRSYYDKALMLPQQAIVRFEGQSQVWVIDENSQVRLIPVELGELVDRYYRLKAGVMAGQKIVVEGMDRLVNGMEVRVQEWTSNKSVSAIAH
ncbi:MAG: efflux RND transporter periplasmic adaptor subunit [Gammaproteobacteria bacterium]|uniref:efflux RND transporter periplasmic adaptor subunit n=1 Tax=Marinomonas sp. BSi20584 TaxID=1594462 RepID=UPI000C1DE3C0|nr:efflux RND transporter periplasmic adaptor subunit [Marinomonas sp. BSi20584]MBU1296396.1 efflux RND transporter periplasmic adaptor subunit [Gammaproteobacteria bacterium]PJE55662.1 RND transporter [Marinomonas sp. BSi20584]